VGDEESGLIDNCSATGQITGSTGSWAGGLVASVDAKSIIENSFATGMVSTGDAGSHSSNAGGIVGAALGAKINIENTYATGNVSGGGNAFVGGLIGKIVQSTGKLSKSYAIGSVTGGSGANVGGLVGNYTVATFGTYTFQDTYWDTDTSGASAGTGNDGTPAGMSGLTSSQFLSRLPKGLSKKYWSENSGINGGFPYLLSNPPPQ
jgi:hypothetical protein